jgi:hypothetical protein
MDNYTSRNHDQNRSNNKSGYRASGLSSGINLANDGGQSTIIEELNDFLNLLDKKYLSDD